MLPQMWQQFQHHPIWTVLFKPNSSYLRPVFSIMKMEMEMLQNFQIRHALIWRKKSWINLIFLHPMFMAEVGTEMEMLKKLQLCPITIWREKRQILWIHRREGDCTNVWMIWWQLWGNFQHFLYNFKGKIEQIEKNKEILLV